MQKFSLLCLLAALASLAFAQKEITMATEKGNITLLMDNLSTEKYDETILNGTIRNDTAFKMNYLMFELVGYNASNVDVKVCGPIIGCWFHVFDALDSHSSLRLRSPGNFIILRSTLKPNEIARSEFRVLELSYFVKYDIRSSPVVNAKYAIAPTFTPNGVALEFRNTSSDVIEVAWDQSVYIDEDGNSSRLIRGNVNLAEKDRSQPNTVIPPGTKLQETVFPVDHIKNVDGKWKQVPLVPETVQILDPQYATSRSIERPALKMLAGKELRLFLRLLINDQKQNVTIPFKIVDMVQ